MKHPASLPGLPDDYAGKFFVGDVVWLKESNVKALVSSTWADEEDFEGENMPRGPHRPLLRGEVAVNHGTSLTIVPESQLVLFRREVVRGDVVKNNLAEQEAALVLSARTEYQLSNVFDEDNKVEDWVSIEKLQDIEVYYPGYQVTFGNWLGVIDYVCTAVYCWNAQRKELYQFYDTTGGAAVGLPREIVVESIMARMEFAPSFRFAFPSWSDPKDQVVRLVALSARVSWLAINQKIPYTQHGEYPEPKEDWEGAEIGQLVRTSNEESQRTQLGRLFTFKDEEERKYYNIKTVTHQPELGAVCVMRVTNARTYLDLLWQDGHRTQAMSDDVVPHDNMDLLEAFPGHNVTRIDDDGRRRTGVVQICDPIQRTAKLLMHDTSTIEAVSLLEIDPGSEDDNDFGIGLILGEEVLLCEDNRSPTPHVPLIGQPPNRLGDEPHILSEISKKGPVQYQDVAWKLVRPDAKDIDWFGEVTFLHNDGEVSVLLTNGTTVKVPTGKLYKLNQIEDDMMDIDPENDDEYREAFMDEVQELGLIQGFGLPPMSSLMSYLGGGLPRGGTVAAQQPFDFLTEGSEASWETTSNEDDDIGVLDGSSPRPDESEEKDDSASDDAHAVEKVIPLAPPSPASVNFTSQAAASSSSMPTTDINQAGPSSVRTRAWEPFTVHEAAPTDHHFYRQPPASLSRARMKKLHEEHKSLDTSLPDNILVRTYEDRMDLMRVLIIGTDGTPYFGAPFVFDIFLHANYPFEPPHVHFHSHTNGKGRCNPNLYEEGKVCLSILGTWQGDASESWDPKRSSLLQIFVSISGLVLVRDPYFCEPAYAKLEGTEEGRLQARLYAEKAYVLSRAFVYRAVSSPPSGFKTEINSYYLMADNIQNVILHARRLMDKTAALDKGQQGGASWDADAIGSLTAGAKLSLERTIERLETIRRNYLEPQQAAK